MPGGTTGQLNKKWSIGVIGTDESQDFNHQDIAIVTAQKNSAGDTKVWAVWNATNGRICCLCYAGVEYVGT